MDAEVRREWASPMALELLDEMLNVFDECAGVLCLLADEADLNLEELAFSLNSARRDAQAALHAAILLNAHADMGESWTSGRSRPRGVLARHQEAVRSGADKATPAEPTRKYSPFFSDGSFRVNWNHSGTVRPRCSATAMSTGNQCGNAVVAVGGGDYLGHCRQHLDSSERDRYEASRAEIDRASRRHEELLTEQIQIESAAAADVWLSRRNYRSTTGSGDGQIVDQ